MHATGTCSALLRAHANLRNARELETIIHDSHTYTHDHTCALCACDENHGERTLAHFIPLISLISRASSTECSLMSNRNDRTEIRACMHNHSKCARTPRRWPSESVNRSLTSGGLAEHCIQTHISGALIHSCFK